MSAEAGAAGEVAAEAILAADVAAETVVAREVLGSEAAAGAVAAGVLAAEVAVGVAVGEWRRASAAAVVAFRSFGFGAGGAGLLIHQSKIPQPPDDSSALRLLLPCTAGKMTGLREQEFRLKCGEGDEANRRQGEQVVEGKTRIHPHVQYVCQNMLKSVSISDRKLMLSLTNMK